jgi:hypothetical protein
MGLSVLKAERSRDIPKLRQGYAQALDEHSYLCDHHFAGAHASVRHPSSAETGMGIVEEQEEIAQRYEAALALVEPHLVKTEDGQFSFGDADLSVFNIDPMILQSIVASVDDLNAAIANGELAADDVRTETVGVG